ncbi:LOW QUALITY PROTEIN: protein unc-93 homolog B1 [Myotis lucifugus]|uniref:LOW QUALITY PROTEIN: protein unc-93 homolog B1 n=1 Tax=Myotis lucifugus TaxID=59463 RepID=UPI000CCC820F|nr:LOW QUALITY PROTEIN: protein unc-93 homolog B1 [Myotis lucifugus]
MAEPPLYPVAGAAGPQGDEDRLGLPDGSGAPLDELVGAYPNYNEEEEERRYYRRKRLGVLKNVLAASAGGMLTYAVYLGCEPAPACISLNAHRFFGTKWMMFLGVGIYALFVSTNYWERYYTLVPSAVALGMAIVPLWASMGNYITRMAQKYYEYSHYKERDEQGPQQRPPRGSHAPYLLVFQTIFYSFFHLSFACAQLPMIYFLNHYLYDLNHTLSNVHSCGLYVQGPRALVGEVQGPIKVLGLCGAAYRPTEEIDLRSVGWGNIFQLPFKHVRDFRLRHLVPFFIYSGFEVLFACTGLALGYGVCSVGLERLAYLLVAYGLGASASSLLGLLGLWLPRQVPLLSGAGLHLLLTVSLFFWAPTPRVLQHIWILYVAAILWGVGSGLNKTGLSTLLGILYEDKERQDFIFTIYHWWQAVAIFVVYLGSSLPMKAKLAVLLLTLVVATLSYLAMEQKLRRGVAPRQPRIPRPQHKVRGYRYLEEDNSDESDAEGERGAAAVAAAARGDGGEEEPLPAGPGPEPAGFCRRPCPYEQAQGGDGPEEQ